MLEHKEKARKELIWNAYMYVQYTFVHLEICKHTWSLVHSPHLMSALTRLLRQVVSNFFFVELIYLNVNNLFHNFLIGEMPLSLDLSNLKLEDFDVSQNILHGMNIPPHLCVGNALKYVILNSNWLSRSIPSDLLNCPSLILLQLESSLLNGLLPKISISPLSLQFLRISNNSLTGNIPAKIGNVSSLQALLITQHQFAVQFATGQKWLNRSNPI